MSDEIKVKLIELEHMQAQLAAVARSFAALRADVIPADVQAELDAIDAEWKPVLDRYAQNAQALKEEIKAAVIALGASVKGNCITAQYSRGRTSYDSKRLDGLALAFPQINECKRVGEPSVSFREE